MPVWASFATASESANSRALTKGIGPHGELIDTLPLGFYLRKNFTEILQDFFDSKLIYCFSFQ